MAIRVLVVEDSVTVRHHLCDVLGRHGDLVVVGEASTGQRAIELCETLRPDIVTMDMVLPEMTGLEATEYIMGHCPTPILIVSASMNRGDLFKTYDALAAGAVDVLEKPPGDDQDGRWERDFIAAVRLTSRIRVITHPRARLKTLNRTAPAMAAPSQGIESGVATQRLIALGASTGGPAAVVGVLRALPSPLDVPVLLVLHIAEPFGVAFADWLDKQTGHRVVYAQDGDVLADKAGSVLMAPPDWHLVVRRGRVGLTKDPPRHSCRPSVDVLFESLAAAGPSVAAVLLTGMGRDGASGLLEIRRAGGSTIAQDEATSVVFGMPREAILLGAAEQVLPIGEIGPALLQLVSAGREGRQR